VSTAISLLLAVTLLVAALAKLRDPAPFRATLRTLTGARTARVLTVAVPMIEGALAGALIAGVSAAALGVFVLMLAFTAVLGRLVVPCNCFGARSDTPPAAARVRNLLLAAAALALVVWPAEALWQVAAGEMLAAATVVVGAICVWRLSAALASA
jgi:hypothetical protein